MAYKLIQVLGGGAGIAALVAIGYTISKDVRIGKEPCPPTQATWKAETTIPAETGRFQCVRNGQPVKDLYLMCDTDARRATEACKKPTPDGAAKCREQYHIQNPKACY